MILSWTKCPKNTSLTPLQHQPELLIQGLTHAFMLCTPNCDPKVQMSLHKSLIRPGNIFSTFCPVLVSLCKLQIQFPVSQLRVVVPCVIFCCYSFKVQRAFISAYIGCNKWLFDLLLPSFLLELVKGINKAFSPIELPLTGSFLEQVMWENPSKYSDQFIFHHAMFEEA